MDLIAVHKERNEFIYHLIYKKENKRMFSKLALPLIATLGVQDAQAAWGFLGCPGVAS